MPTPADPTPPDPTRAGLAPTGHTDGPRAASTGAQPTGIELAPGVRVPADRIEVTFARSSGPGGQNVNKRSTRAVLRIAARDLPLDPGWLSRLRRAAGPALTPSDDILIASDEHRSQARNKQACFDRLRALLVGTRTPPKVRRPTKPTRGSVERRLAAKQLRADRKRGRSGGGEW